MQSPIFIQTGTISLAWFFTWGNILFIGITVILILYVFLHSYFKEIPALLYRLITAIPAILIIPSIVFSIVSYQIKVSIQNFILLFFILGLLGGIIPIVSSIIYTVYFTSFSKKKMEIPYIQSIDDSGQTERQYIDERTKVEVVPMTKGYLINKSTGKTYTLSNINIIGRGSLQEEEGNKIKLNDPYTSRIHARMIFDGNRFKISDSSSASGTYINNQKIKGWVTLEDGDEIKIGRTFLKFTQAK